MQQLLRRAAAVLAVALGCTVPFAPSAEATSDFGFSRLAGGDRFETAAAVARATFGFSTTAVIASGRDFPDALAGNYLAGRLQAPVLLAERTSVPPATMSALQALNVQEVVLLGGEGALGPAVVAALEAAGVEVERIAGGDRFATAAAVARAGGPPPTQTALLASGRSFPDALAAGPLAYGSALPQLLTEPGSLSPATTAVLVELGITNVIILGGPGAVSDAVAGALQAQGYQVGRLAGGDRYATSVAIADFAVGALGHDRAHVDVATGTNFPDALAGGAHAGTGRGVVLLAEPGAAAADGDAAQYLRTHTAVVAAGHAFGGTGAVDDTALAGLTAAGRNAAPPPPPPPPTNDCATALFGMVNQARAQNGRAAYTHSAAAAGLAQTWSQYLASQGGLSHNPQVASQLSAAGVAWTMWAENVAFGSTPTAVHNVLMGSTVHRGNILSPGLTHIGIGCVDDGAGLLWVTQVFYRT